MAEMGVYKLDNNGEMFPSNCFPIRPIFHQSREGAGHWLVAHRRDVEKRHKITKKQKSEQSFCPAPSVGSESENVELKKLKGADNATLNRQLLMMMYCVDKPSDLCSVDISEKKLQRVELEGLEEFDNVAYINASDNSLALELFGIFPALRELELPLNGLATLEVHATDFPRLEVLDLSYNNLSAEGILAVGQLLHLKVLHLTGNNLQMLPPDMACPYTPLDQMAPQSSSLFQSLEVLLLDDNRLTSTGLFRSLANLKRLQHLDLQGNHISAVPYLEEMPTSTALETEGTRKDTTWTECFSDLQVDQQEFVNRGADKGVRPYSKDFSPPFPQLQYLNLASNEIAEEEALLAVALFPMLSELIIHSNPLTTRRSGSQPVLTYFLQEKLGINIKRKNTTIVKTRIRLQVNPKRKVKNKIPKVPKVPLTTATLCSSGSLCREGGNKSNSPLPPDSRFTDVSHPCSSQTSTEEREEDIAAASGSELLKGVFNEPQKTEEQFFVTEIPEMNDLLRPGDQENIAEPEEITQNVRKDPKDCPESLKGYEVLLDDSLDFDMPEPVGIQHCVKVLEHTLKNLLVYRDSKANLDHLQRPCREQQKRIKNLPPLKPCLTKGEKAKELVAEMKERKTISEVPLDKVIGGKDTYRNEYEEAMILLKDMKRKYKMVYLKAMEQAAQIECLSLNLNVKENDPLPY